MSYWEKIKFHAFSVFLNYVNIKALPTLRTIGFASKKTNTGAENFLTTSMYLLHAALHIPSDTSQVLKYEEVCYKKCTHEETDYEPKV